MTKMFFGVLGCLVLSTPVLAEGISEFERGYAEGQKSCVPPTTVYYCQKPAVRVYSATEATGRTKAEAILKLGNYGIAAMIAEGKTIKCVSLANEE